MASTRLIRIPRSPSTMLPKVSVSYLSLRLSSTVTRLQVLLKKQQAKSKLFRHKSNPLFFVWFKINEWDLSFDLTFLRKKDIVKPPQIEKFWRIESQIEKKSARTHSRRTERFRNFPLVSDDSFSSSLLWLGSRAGVYRGRRAGSAGYTEKKKP